MNEEERDMAIKLAVRYSESNNEILVSVAEKIYNFFMDEKGTFNTTKYRAIHSAVTHCQTNRNESLFLTAEKIYEFLIKEK